MSRIRDAWVYILRPAEFCYGRLVRSIVPIKYLKHLFSLDDTSIINVNQKNKPSTLQSIDAINRVFFFFFSYQ